MKPQETGEEKAEAVNGRETCEENEEEKPQQRGERG